MKKYCPLIMGILVTLLLELVVFNFSSVKALFNQEIDLSGNTQIEYADEQVICMVSDIDTRILNLYLDVDCEENSPVAYNIAMTDEGNYYDYYLPEGVLYAKSPASRYINLHSYGNVRSLTISFSSADSPYIAPFTVNCVRANVKRPVFFNGCRMALVFLFILFSYYLRIGSPLWDIPLEGKTGTKAGIRQLLIILLVALGCISFGFVASSSHKLFNEAAKPHHQQYKELARALSNGQVTLPDVPSEGLRSAPNPYDTIYLQANGIEYKADYAYYDGAYYVYFGIIPELLLYFPYHLMTGGDFPNHFAVFVFYAVFVIGVFGFLKEVCCRFLADEKVSFIVYLLIASGISIAPTFAYIFFTADLYSVPIMAALGFTALGLALWLHGLNYEHGKCLSYALGSLCMASVAGCRPQLLLFSALGLVLFWNEVFKERTLFTKKSLSATLALCLPYLIIALVTGYYNYARFGSVLDFGATYSLTNNDMNLRGVSLSRMLLGLGCFLFTPPKITASFPFLQSTDLAFGYMGRIVTEHYYGGILFMGIWGISLFAIPHYSDVLKRYRLTALIITSLCISVIIGLMDANAAGVLQRYTADMALGILLASGIMLIVLVVKHPVGGTRFLKAGFWLGLLMTFMMICNTYSGITLKYYNPELFGLFESIFRF